jgi:hypothetical protein
MRKIIAIGIFLILVGVVFAATPVNAAFTTYAQPDTAYLSEATEKIDISGLTNGMTFMSITDGYMTVGFDSSMEKTQVGVGWATWDSPPWTETATPHILFKSYEDSVEWKLSKPTWVFGFELEPNNMNVHKMTVKFYHDTTLVGSIVKAVDGNAGARLFAIKSLDDPINRVEISAPSAAHGFGVAQIRYSRIEIGKHYTYTDVDFAPYHYEPGPDGKLGTIDDIKVMDPAKLGTPLKSIHMVINHDKVKSHNPGQFYGVIEITGPVQKFRFRDDFDREFDVHPSKIGTGGCQVIILDPKGFAKVITNSDQVEIKKIVNDNPDKPNKPGYVEIDFKLSTPLKPGYTLMVYIKFQTAYKNEKYGGDKIFWDQARIDIPSLIKWDFDTGKVKLPITGIPT